MSRGRNSRRSLSGYDPADMSMNVCAHGSNRLSQPERVLAGTLVPARLQMPPLFCKRNGRHCFDDTDGLHSPHHSNRRSVLLASGTWPAVA